MHIRNTHICTCTYVHICISTHMHARTHTDTYIHTHIDNRSIPEEHPTPYIHACIHTCIDSRSIPENIPSLLRLHTYIHTYAAVPSLRISHSLHTYMHTYIHSRSIPEDISLPPPTSQIKTSSNVQTFLNANNPEKNVDKRWEQNAAVYTHVMKQLVEVCMHLFVCAWSSIHVNYLKYLRIYVFLCKSFCVCVHTCMTSQDL